MLFKLHVIFRLLIFIIEDRRTLKIKKINFFCPTADCCFTTASCSKQSVFGFPGTFNSRLLRPNSRLSGPTVDCQDQQPTVGSGILISFSNQNRHLIHFSSSLTPLSLKNPSLHISNLHYTFKTPPNPFKSKPNFIIFRF